jgi:sialate O-acetylesterase
MKRFIFVLALVLLCATTHAKVELPNFLGDNMVLQQQTEAALWGTATPGKTVTIRPGWTRGKTVVKADLETGKWFARILTPAAAYFFADYLQSVLDIPVTPFRTDDWEL